MVVGQCACAPTRSKKPLTISHDYLDVHRLVRLYSIPQS